MMAIADVASVKVIGLVQPPIKKVVKNQEQAKYERYLFLDEEDTLLGISFVCHGRLRFML